jgi:hypothetical protein
MQFYVLCILLKKKHIAVDKCRMMLCYSSIQTSRVEVGNSSDLQVN